MIEVEVKTLEFGDGNIGIGSAIKTDGTGSVYFTDLNKSYPIGKRIENINEVGNLVVRLCFKKVESIDVVIKHLKRAKKMMLRKGV